MIFVNFQSYLVFLSCLISLMSLISHGTGALVHIGYKDAVLEPSSALHHVTELCSILQKQTPNPVLFIYTDGRLTYFSVQLSLIALFRKLNLDLIASRTAPCGTYHEHCEPWSSVCWDDAKRRKPGV